MIYYHLLEFLYWMTKYFILLYDCTLIANSYRILFIKVYYVLVKIMPRFIFLVRPSYPFIALLMKLIASNVVTIKSFRIVNINLRNYQLLLHSIYVCWCNLQSHHKQFFSRGMPLLTSLLKTFHFFSTVTLWM